MNDIRSHSPDLSSPPSDNQPEFVGRYRIIRRLGEGGMGSVFLAQDTILLRDVALKLLLTGTENDPEVRERFLREARSAATLDHPYICPVFDANEVDGRPYLAMAYIEGKSLADMVRAEGIPPRQVVALVGKLAIAMNEAHLKGVVHRDLKPRNVMIRSVGTKREPVIVDFGLARLESVDDVRMTKTGQVMGTPAYMAPEQLRGNPAEIGPACDIYALGVILYELLTGHLPFSGPYPVLVAQILTQMPLPPSSHRQGLDPMLDEICLKAMAKEISQRYATMMDLATALTGYLREAPSVSVSNRPVAPISRPIESDSIATGADTLLSQFLGREPEKGLKSDVAQGTPTHPTTLGRADKTGGRKSLRRELIASAVLGVLILLGILVLIFVTNPGTVADKGLASVDTKISPPNVPAPKGSGKQKSQTRKPVDISIRKSDRSQPPAIDQTTTDSPGSPPPQPNRFPLPGEGRTNDSPETEKAVDVSPPVSARPESTTKLPVAQTPIKNSIGMPLVLIPPGDLMMGEIGSSQMSRADPNAIKGATPRHKVRLTKPFLMGVHEVTQANYAKIMKSDPSVHKGENLPVDSVSWIDAINFCNKLSAVEGLKPYYKTQGDQVSIFGGNGYRLPTEAEWEYACRAGSQTVYEHGDEVQGIADRAWIAQNSNRTTHSVGQKIPNQFGLYDMLGNVAEWCWDWHGEYSDEVDLLVDPQGPDSGTERVLRGGGYPWQKAVSLTPANRLRGSGIGPDRLGHRNGFRVARTSL